MTDAARSDRALRPRDAATLILVERAERDHTRVLMGKRHAGHRFMPGKFVFPGGRVEPGTGGWPPPARSIPMSRRSSTLACAGRRRISPAPWRWRRSARPSRKQASRSALPIMARRQIRRRAPGPASRRPASRHRSTPSTFSPARSPRPDAPGASTPASLSPTRTHRRACRGGYPSRGRTGRARRTPLDEALNLDLPDITRAALADLALALDGGLDKRRPRPFYRQLRGKRLREQL